MGAGLGLPKEPAPPSRLFRKDEYLFLLFDRVEVKKDRSPEENTFSSRTSIAAQIKALLLC